MAEAIAAISIAANIVQFVDFTAKILSASHRIKGSGFRDNDWMAIVVKDLQKVSSGLKSPLVQENGRFPTDNDMELLHLAKQDEIKESQPAQAEPQNNVHILDKPALGVGEQFLGYIEESKRWQTDLINAIHQHSSTAGERSVETVTAIDLKRDERLWKQILERLRFAEMTDRRDRIVEAHNKTFRWIFDAPGSAENMATVWPSFSDWLRNGSGLYWIAGKAGSGKSTLMKYIYDNTRTVQLLQEWCGESDLTVASFYFWNSGVDMQMSEMGLLRSILLQLLTKHKEFIPRLFPGRWEAYVLFDGLDEFDGDHSELNDLFKTLASFSHIKVCVSSRPWNVFEDDFGVKSCLMLQDLTYQDIKLFVDSRFDEDHGFSELEIREPSYAAELKESVARKAEGLLEVPRGYLDSHHDTTQSSEFQSGNFSNGRGKGPVKNMTVQYLHRTVKDFLARPDRLL
ncbi:hypothetical protein M7I_5283 [Glarea lozoyensis 74030]|uniref:NACHT domain-containing protein n=1 Tax=Glarea lozoyensis (strain ATCC 74030 / MF5533) TaxID=1104152 RepID=H0ERG4_GLAL7|nr:hypothetical protein M7I_5283 [Glarea lozoyensis 74030]